MKGRAIVGGITLLFVGAIGSAYITTYQNSDKIAKLERPVQKVERSASPKEAADLRSLEKSLGRTQLEVKDKSEQINQLAQTLDEVHSKYNAAQQELAVAKKEIEKLTEDNQALNKKLKKSAKDDDAKKVYAKVNYYRPDRDFHGWGVHATGRAVPTSTPWSDPIDFKYISAFGAYARIPLHDDHKEFPLQVLVHNGPEIDCDPDPEGGGSGNGADKSMKIDVSKHKEIWLVSGNSNVFLTEEDALEAIER